jgi:hypothetical protein
MASLPPLSSGQEGGLLVQVHEGGIALTQDGVTLEFSKGQTGYVNLERGTPQRLDAAPASLTRDPFTRSINFDSVSCTLP